jgi:RNA-splicing ligase RtcB
LKPLNNKKIKLMGIKKIEEELDQKIIKFETELNRIIIEENPQMLKKLIKVYKI